MWYENEHGERIIGGWGWAGIVCCCIMFLPLGLIMLVGSIIWKAGSNAARYNREVMRNNRESDYAAYKQRMNSTDD